MCFNFFIKVTSVSVFVIFNMSFFENVVNDAVAEFKVNFLRAFKDKNTIKVSISDPPKKKVLSYPTHQAIFAKGFGTGFKMEEKVPDLNIRFKLESANRITEIFGTSPIMRGDFPYYGIQ